MLTNSVGYLIALLLTMAIEAVIVLFFGYRKISEIAIILFINLMANQIINIYLYINKYSGILKVKTKTIFLLEIAVVAITWLLLGLTLQQSPEKLLVLSLILTFFSYLAGALIFPRLTSPSGR